MNKFKSLFIIINFIKILLTSKRKLINIKSATVLALSETNNQKNTGTAIAFIILSTTKEP
jgi:hypothetical protein